MLPSSGGIAPVSRLRLRSSAPSESSPPSSGGMLPVSRLSLRFSSQACRLASPGGIVPVRPLPLRSSVDPPMAS